MRKGFVTVVAMLVVTVATPAFGHVSVSPTRAAKGTTATFTFVVPNEEAPAKTTSLEIVFPQGVTFARVGPAPKPGWTATPSKSSVVWSGATIAGEDKETFSVTLGPLPNRETIVFKALQTYDNGSVVRWIGAEAADNPAPVVELTGEPMPTVVERSAAGPPTTAARAKAEERDDGTNVMPIVFGALVLAGIGVGLALGARRRSGNLAE